jgi:hypothetical protein
VFCSFTIPIGFKAVGRPSEFDAEGLLVSDTDPFLEVDGCEELGLSDDCEVEGRGVSVGEVAILAWQESFEPVSQT